MFSIFKASTAMHSYPHKTALVRRLSSSLFRISCINASAASASSLNASSSSTRLRTRSIVHRTSDSPLPSESEFMPLYCDLNLILRSLCFFCAYEREPLSASVFYDYLLYLPLNRAMNSYGNISYLWDDISNLLPVSILKPDWFIKLLNFPYLYRSFPTFFPFFFSSDKV